MNNDTIKELLYSEGEKLQKEAQEKRAEAKKLNSNREWFGLMALDKVERKEAKKVFNTSDKCRDAENKLKAAKNHMEMTRAEEFPDVVKALEEVKAVKLAMREFILTGKATEYNGRKITTLSDVLAIYKTISERVQVKANPDKIAAVATATA